ncbi:MAG TPA: hypothetical protein VJY39_19380 [Acidisphaera sp.]|nr:hypothetical protein [Acidisphaera sp.]
MRLVPSRRSIARLLTVGVILGQLMPSAFAQCARPADKAALDIAGLKSELMVIALECDVRDRYNDFVGRFKSELMNEERGLNAYFARAYGRSGRAQHDDYITNLANVQSESGIKRGTFFCKENVGLFDQVLALPPGSDLASFAASKQLVQPIDVAVCDTTAPERRTRTASASHH